MTPRLPRFKTEDEIREFWANHDSTDYFDELEELPEGVTMLSPRRTITLQVDEAVLDRLKKLAVARRVSYRVLAQRGGIRCSASAGSFCAELSIYWRQSR